MRQKTAVLKILLTKPRVLLLDEPTNGLDNESRDELGKILRELASSGVSVVMAAHDMEFAAKYADRFGLLFDGEIAVEESSRGFFSKNQLFTTEAARITRGIYEGIVTTREVIEICVINGKKE